MLTDRALPARSDPRSAAGRWFLGAAAAAGLIAVGFLVLLLRTAPHTRLVVEVDDVGTLALVVLASAGCGAAAWRHRGHARTAWLLIGVGCLSWAFGEGAWAWLELIRGEANPFPSLADVGYLGAVPLLATGVALLRPASTSMRSRVRAVADGLIAAAGLLAISWMTVLGQVWAAGGDSAVALGISVAYPAGDVLVLSMLVFLAMRIPSDGRLPVWLLIAGMAVQACADSGFAYLSATNAYDTTSVVNVAYWVGYMLIALAGLRAAMWPMPSRQAAAQPGALGLALPYIPALGALGMAVWAEFDHGLDPFLFTCLASLVAAVLLRQFLAGSDNLVLVRRLARRESELRHQADHDALTGLVNRARLQRELAARLTGANSTPCALLFIDVDNLKPVNDRYGHVGGDVVLQATAARLAKSVRAGDVAARVGGDEFAVLLPDLTDPASAADVADRIIDSMATPVHITGGQPVEVSVSIGIATSDSGSPITPAQLVSRADLAMYAAKAACMGIAVQWDPSLEGGSHPSPGWKSDLEQAVADEQFALQYQPVIDTATRRIVAVEALLRWKHPRAGLLTPERFLGDLEATGLIVPVGEWALQQACRQVRSWSQRFGVALDVHVNVSARQLSRPDFPHVVRQTLESTQLEAHQLVIELTETSLIESTRAAATRLRAIKRLGCRIALDDFGTGYSSLSHLQDLPVDVIKIDRSFITGLSLDTARPTLAGVLVSLGISMGKQVIAEGVETEEQLGALIALHCPTYQGFHASRPVDADRLAAMLVADASASGSPWAGGADVRSVSPA